jgi:hypothetical protein
MRHVIMAGLLLALATPVAHAADQLAEARRLYNSGQFEAAEKEAREATLVDGQADAARVVLGRILTEKYRQSADAADLKAARESLRQVDPRPLGFHDRLELTIGQGEVLFFDDRFGAAAEVFETVLDRSTALGNAAHDRVLDWWATALDRHAQSRSTDDRPPIYDRIIDRMRSELALDPGSGPASYWMAAAARGAGDLDRAWQAAIAGWVRASQTRDHGAALRADLDRLVTEAIIPERAARLQLRDPKQAAGGMQNEWDAFKEGWNK